MSHWHGVLLRIATEIDEVSAERLARAFGGTRLFIPLELRRDHRLVKLLGFDAAKQLHRMFGEGYLQIPLGSASNQNQIRIAIERGLKDGVPHQQIARELRVHVRTVERTAARLRGQNDPRQTNMFD